MYMNPKGPGKLTMEILARVSVQFQSVVERFMPHDTVFSITAPTDLKETALSSACSLHTASASIKSSNSSLRGRGLAEIAEVVGEQQDSTPRLRHGEADGSNSNEDKSPVHNSTANVNHEPTLLGEVQPHSQCVTQTVTSTDASNTVKALPATPSPSNVEKVTSRTMLNEFVYNSEPRMGRPGMDRVSLVRPSVDKPNMDRPSMDRPSVDRVSMDRPSMDRPSMDRPSVDRVSMDRPSMDRPSMDRPSVDRVSMDRPSMDRASIGRTSIDKPSMDRRHLSPSTRSTTRDVYSTYKPNVKLGPRPSVDSSGRPHTSGSYSRPTEPRPVSTLPAGVRMPARTPLSVRPQSQQTKASFKRGDDAKLFLSPPPVQETPTYSVDRSYSSPGNANGILRHAYTAESKPPTMTPEKQRLMKALQLRKQRMATQECSASIESQSTVPSSAGGAIYPHSSDAKDKDNPSISHDVVAIELRPNTGGLATDEPIPASIHVPANSLTHPPGGSSTQALSFIQEQGSDVQKERRDAPEKTEIPSEDSGPVIEGMEGTTASSFEPVGCVKTIGATTDQRLLTTTDSDQSHDTLPQEVPLPIMTEEEVLSLSPQRVVTKETQEALHIASKLEPDTSKGESTLQKAGTASPGRDDVDDIRPSTAETVDLRAIERRAWRHGLVDPVHIGSSVDDSDDLNFLSDDSFMEELKSATLQEAKPISVSKSPITPVFPRRLSDQRTNGISPGFRAVSNPFGDVSAQSRQHLSPELPVRGSLRSVSASPSPEITSQQASALMAKKVNVSSGISQRIKALEMFTSRENSPVVQSHSSTTSPVGSVSSLRNTSLTTPPHKYDSFKSSGATKHVEVPHFSPSASPKAVISDHKSRSASIPIAAKNGKPRPKSISVTATIVRDARNGKPQVPVDPSEPAAMDLHHSPLVIEHQTTEAAREQSQGKTSKSDRPSSIHSSSPESRRDSITSGRSISSRKESRPNVPRSMSDTSSNGLTSPDEQQEEKTRSKKSRLFKRMSSSFSSASRRSLVQALSPTVKEEPIFEHYEPVARVLPNLVDVGDVNVQFPDTLVWNCISNAHCLSADQSISFGSEGV